jgi:deoxyadenosine/deoxycytidine kinase
MAQSSTRIILTGTSSVGKTTLGEALAPKLGLPFIPEIGRVLLAKAGYKTFGEVPEQERFKCNVLDKQIEAEEQAGSFVADRSTFDYWVLWQRWNICQAMTYETEKFYEQARKQSEKYTAVIYIPPSIEAVSDDVRWIEPDYRKQVDRIIKMTLYDWNLLEKTYTVKSTVLQERIDEVLAWLGKQ